MGRSRQHPQDRPGQEVNQEVQGEAVASHYLETRKSCRPAAATRIASGAVTTAIRTQPLCHGRLNS